MSLAPELRQKIESIITSDPVVLFMKGTRSFPQCGFSAAVVQILDTMVPEYTTVNVLSDPAIREGIKQFSNWPTIPQLYVRGELVGGADIVRQMHAAGDLQRKLGDLAQEPTPPSITVTAAAAAVLREALAEAEAGDLIHLSVDGRWDHGLDVGPPEPGELTVESGGVTVAIAPGAVKRLAGVVIDFVDGPAGSGFKIDNPNRPPSVRSLPARQLKTMLDEGELTELYDVRTEAERQVAAIAGVPIFDDAAMARLEKLDRATPLAFICHSGGRSYTVAEHFVTRGFKTVFNVAGGIDAWSREVDPSIPRY